MSETWIRPSTSWETRDAQIAAEARGDFKTAALCALTLADYAEANTDRPIALRATDQESWERQAQVYATLHTAEMALWIAENRAPIDYSQLQ